MCWTAGVGGRKKVDEDKDLRDFGESGRDDQERNGSRKGWLEQFSTIKVGSLKNVKAMMGSNMKVGKNHSSGGKATCQRMTMRPARVEAKRSSKDFSM